MKLWNLTVTYFSYLEHLGKPVNTAVGIVCVLLLGFADYSAGLFYSLQLFYLLPVFFVSLAAGRNPGLFISLLSTYVWMIANNNIALTLPQIWNGLTLLGFLVVTSLLLSRMKGMYEQERSVSRTDHLTGALNSRAFFEAASLQLLILSRNQSPITLAYIDIDNFKEVNDLHGHSTGDRLLQTFVSTLAKNLRRTDMIARLGGDEFCLLLPDTDDKSARVVIYKLFETLQEIVNGLNWNVTFSIGVLTCFTPPESADKMISMADMLMYEIKHGGKNNVKFMSYSERQEPVNDNLYAL